MTEQEIKDFLADNKDSIAAAVKKAAIDGLLSTYNWDISAQIRKAVSDFTETEIVPAVQAELADQKSMLIGVAVKALESLSDNLATGLAGDAAKVVGDEWKRKSVLKALFNL